MYKIGKLLPLFGLPKNRPETVFCVVYTRYVPNVAPLCVVYPLCIEQRIPILYC